MQEYVDKELRKVLLHALSQVPYYSSRFREFGLSEANLQSISVDSLWKIPITPKEDLRRAPESFLASNIVAGKKLHRYYSSGTTGTPITSICTAEDHRRYIAAREVRSFNWAGATIRSPRSMIGGRLVVPRGISKPPFHRYNFAEHQIYFSAYHISPRSASEYVSALNRHRPRLFTGYAYSHFLLARMMKMQGLKLEFEPTALVLGSEKLTVPMKVTIAEAFRARAYEEYGAVENCVLATECDQGRLHVNPDFGIVEIVDTDGMPVPRGVEGRIVCTSLLSEAQPLIRYDIGDIGRWSLQDCPCGRNHLPVLEEIVGRLEDVVVGPDGRQMVRFHGIFVGLENVIEGQVVQEERDRFVVNVVTTPAFAEGDVDVIRKRFLQRLGPVAVDICRVQEIQRTERGKFRAVISRVH
jgi:phenylacetate-CoA ligase